MNEETEAVLMRAGAQIAELQMRIAELEAEIDALKAAMDRITRFLRDDSVAMTFQTLGQYRSAAIDAAKGE